jgi:CRP-like cAMP-binding protein
LAARPHATSCVAREDSIVLALDRTVIEALRATPRPMSWHLTDHLHANLVHLLRRCTDVASRLDLERQLPVSRTEPLRV